ncbi:hypothetical protein ILUMI_07556 [Ignelater luminosus]|uniref:Uncharacterized protein n=1 Tax=Ignelater luminosus TaxID=2038154 RepID=A0A8K0D377_IGNLU|nr:hypothetical protein ILUMI_07556 [Ignelater luminosus]
MDYAPYNLVLVEEEPTSSWPEGGTITLCHCDFNAIEMIWVWAHAKKYYNDNMGRDCHSADQTIAMWSEALQKL